jgi:hypothetical protein
MFALSPCSDRPKTMIHILAIYNEFQDYNNSRVLDFQTVNHFALNQLSNIETGAWKVENFLNILA